MPVTPFHFGPGALMQASAPRHISFIAFFAANGLIDLESAINMLRGAYVVHAFFHTYLGSLLVIPVILLVFALMRGLARRVPFPDLFRWKELTYAQVFIGALAGAWSHVFIDSFMHFDMQPFWPFMPGNPFAGKVSVELLEAVCVATGVLGLAIAGISAWKRRGAPARIS